MAAADLVFDDSQVAWDDLPANIFRKRRLGGDGEGCLRSGNRGFERSGFRRQIDAHKIHSGRADEASDKEVGGLVVEYLRGVDLLEIASPVR